MKKYPAGRRHMPKLPRDIPFQMLFRIIHVDGIPVQIIF